MGAAVMAETSAAARLCPATRAVPPVDAATIELSLPAVKTAVCAVPTNAGTGDGADELELPEKLDLSCSNLFARLTIFSAGTARGLADMSRTDGRGVYTDMRRGFGLARGGTKTGMADGESQGAADLVPGEAILAKERTFQRQVFKQRADSRLGVGWRLRRLGMDFRVESPGGISEEALRVSAVRLGGLFGCPSEYKR